MSRTQNKQLSRIAQNAGMLNQEFKTLNLKSVSACSGFQSQLESGEASLHNQHVVSIWHLN